MIANIFKKYSGAKLDEIGEYLVRLTQPEVLSGGRAYDIESFVDLDLERISGICPDYTDLPPEIYGMTNPLKNEMLIQSELVESPHSLNFLRSTLAHEVGHCILHVPLLREARKNHVFQQKKGEDGVHLYRKNDQIPIYQNPEWQAWRLAGAILMPAGITRRLIQGYNLDELAQHFVVSRKFVDYRLKSLKLAI